MEHQSNDQHIRGSLNPALRNPLLLVVILVVLTESGFRFSLNISQLLAKAIPVRGAKFEKPAFKAGFLLLCVRKICRVAASPYPAYAIGQ
ncbi:TPA: hypothetical protein ACG0NP_001202 [Enterobacter cloacae]